MMEIEDQIGDAVAREPAGDAPDHWFAGYRNRRLCAHVGERAQARAKTGGEHDGMADVVGHDAIARPAGVDPAFK